MKNKDETICWVKNILHEWGRFSIPETEQKKREYAEMLELYKKAKEKGVKSSELTECKKKIDSFFARLNLYIEIDEIIQNELDPIERKIIFLRYKKEVIFSSIPAFMTIKISERQCYRIYDAALVKLSAAFFKNLYINTEYKFKETEQPSKVTNLKGELWKTLKLKNGVCVDSYKISNFGRIKHKVNGEEKLIKAIVGISLTIGGSVVQVARSQLTAYNLIGPPPESYERPVVKFRDGNKENFAASNLFWSRSSQGSRRKVTIRGRSYTVSDLAEKQGRSYGAIYWEYFGHQKYMERKENKEV